MHTHKYTHINQNGSTVTDEMKIDFEFERNKK